MKGLEAGGAQIYKAAGSRTFLQLAMLFFTVAVFCGCPPQRRDPQTPTLACVKKLLWVKGSQGAVARLTPWP